MYFSVKLCYNGIAFFVNMIDRNKGKEYLQSLDQIDWLY